MASCSRSLDILNVSHLCSNWPYMSDSLDITSLRVSKRVSKSREQRRRGRARETVSMAMATTGSSRRSAGRLTVALAMSLLCFAIPGAAAVDAPIGAPSEAPSPSPSSPATPSGAQPEDFAYYQLWADQEGETHFTKCKMQGFNLTAYSSLPQYVRSDFGGAPKLVVLTELAVGLAQPLHAAPQVQFVTTLSGSWYIQTSDGTRHEFVKGDLLFQDNTPTSPADKTPEHYSGTVGNEPCQQLVVQLTRLPQVDNVCPF